jgi:eukaryotic-like serine/threonine-protein kinase
MTTGFLRLGRFQAEALLGLGGVTETYRARPDPPGPGEAGQLFALKLLRADRGGDVPEVVASFVEAAKRLKVLRLEGVPPVLEVNEGPDVFSISALERGSDLAQVRQEAGPALDATAIGQLATQIAERLKMLHAAPGAPIIHGGICPGNVIVNPSGDVVLLDCGLSAAIRTLTENPIEKWFFTAPELLVGDPPNIASDLYSLGAVLFFLATGRPPFEAETRDDLELAIIKGPARLTDSPPWFANLVRALLSARPKARPASTWEVLRDLNAALVPRPEPQDDPSEDGSEAVVDRPARPARPAAPAPPVPRLAGDAPAAPGPSMSADDPAVGVVYDEEDGESRGGGPAERTPVVLSLPSTTSYKKKKKSGSYGFLALAAGAIGLGGLFLITRSKVVPPADPKPLVDSIGGQRSASPQRVAPDENAAKAKGAASELKISTTPPGAMVWLDGIEQGRSPISIMIAASGHRLVLTAPGYRMHREVVDVSASRSIERELRAINRQFEGPVALNVYCRTNGKYPVFIDGKESGLLCPVEGLKISPGTHMVGVFVIPQNKIWSFERDVAATSPVHRVIFSY